MAIYFLRRGRLFPQFNRYFIFQLLNIFSSRILVFSQYVLHRFPQIDPLFPGVTQIPSRCWADSCLGIHTVNKERRWAGTRCREQTNRQTVQCHETQTEGGHTFPGLRREINTDARKLYNF